MPQRCPSLPTSFTLSHAASAASLLAMRTKPADRSSSRAVREPVSNPGGTQQAATKWLPSALEQSRPASPPAAAQLAGRQLIKTNAQLTVAAAVAPVALAPDELHADDLPGRDDSLPHAHLVGMGRQAACRRGAERAGRRGVLSNMTPKQRMQRCSHQSHPASRNVKLRHHTSSSNSHTAKGQSGSHQ